MPLQPLLPSPNLLPALVGPATKHPGPFEPDCAIADAGNDGISNNKAAAAAARLSFYVLRAAALYSCGSERTQQREDRRAINFSFGGL